MQASDIPYKFGKPWAHDATTGFLTDPLPPTVAGAAASQDLGFPPITAAPIASGGVPPNIADFNGFGFYTTSWDQWQQAGGPVHYDAAFSSNIGGYPNGALLFAASGANWWLSTADNNTSDPDTGGGNWTNVAVSQEWTAGTVGSLSTGLTIVGTELTAQWQVGEVTSLQDLTLVSDVLALEIPTVSNGFASNVGGANISAVASFTPARTGILLVNGQAVQGAGAFTTSSGLLLTTTGITTTLGNISNYNIGSSNPLGICTANFTVTAGTPVTLTLTMQGSGDTSSNLAFSWTVIPTA